jgi:L-rhamnose mutarotase
MSKKYCLTVDLKDDPQLIKEYEAHHKTVWPEIIKSIKDAGILDMDIYRLENRLCMIMEVSDEFSFEKKQQLDEGNARVQEWEELMWKYQQPLAIATKGEKWVLMKNIFTLKDF